MLRKRENLEIKAKKEKIVADFEQLLGTQRKSSS